MKKSNQKFSLEKFEVAKLKNLHLIRGGKEGEMEETGGVIDLTILFGTSSKRCASIEQPNDLPQR